MDADIFWGKIKAILAEKDKNQEWLCRNAGIVLQIEYFNIKKILKKEF